jgi:hypothetical protein
MCFLQDRKKGDHEAMAIDEVLPFASEIQLSNGEIR